MHIFLKLLIKFFQKIIHVVLCFILYVFYLDINIITHGKNKKMQFLSFSNEIYRYFVSIYLISNYYTPRNEVRGGYTGITLSVRLSVRPSVDARAVR